MGEFVICLTKRGAIRVDQLQARSNGSDLGMLIEKFHLLFQALRMRNVIGVLPRDVRSRACIDSHIGGVDDT